MAKSLLRAAVILSFSALLCAALIVMTDTAVYQNLPSMAWVALGAFGIQWLGFIPAFVWQTERYYDLMGSVTFVGSTLLAFYLAEHLTLTSALFGAMVLIWTLRLGGFLFLRILQDGSRAISTLEDVGNDQHRKMRCVSFDNEDRESE
jgi:hypothetical protein